MKTILKRLVLVLVCLALVASFATGCDGGNGGEYDPTAQKDFGGRVFKIGAWWDRTPVEGKTEWDDAFAQRIKEVEDEANCKIEFVTVADTDQAYVTTTLAGDPVCDIATALTWNLLPGYIQGGIAYPLSDLASFDFESEKWLTSAINFGKYKGKRYTMDLKSATDNCVRFGVFYDKRIFNEQGLPDLEELYKNGEWTWDKMLEIAKAVNTDFNGDGEIDTYSIGCEAFMWNFIYSNGGNVFTNDDGTVSATGFEAPQVVEAMDFCAKFQSELANSIFPYDSADTFKMGVLAMGVLEWWNSQNFSSISNAPMMDEYGWVPFPCGPSANGVYYSYGKELSPYFMLSSVQNPQDVAWAFNAITDYADSEEQWNDWLYSVVETWAGDADTVDNIMAMVESGNVIINPLVGYSDLYNVVQDMFKEVAEGSLTTQVALETYSNQITEAVKTANERDYTGEYQDMFDEEMRNKIYDTTEFGTVEPKDTWEAFVQYYIGEDPWFETTDMLPELIDGDPATVYTFTRPHTVNDMFVVNFNGTETIRKIIIDCAGEKSYPTQIKIQYKTDLEGEWQDITLDKNTPSTLAKTMELVLSKNLDACAVMVQIQQADNNRTWDIQDIHFEYVTAQNAPQ